MAIWFSGSDSAAHIASHDVANQPAAGRVVAGWLGRVKAGVKEELPGGPSQDEATVCVVRFWLARADAGFSRGRIEMIFPIRFISEGEGVPREIKSARSGFRGMLGHIQLACGAG